ncbi:MAG: hypothetical protein RLZZ303_3185 [Candidatus Hydrogenedentota bacterium]
MDVKTNLPDGLDALVDQYRAKCLWYFRQDFYPRTPDEALRVLRALERHEDAEAFKRAATMRQWLLQHSSEASAKQ